MRDCGVCVCRGQLLCVVFCPSVLLKIRLSGVVSCTFVHSNVRKQEIKYSRRHDAVSLYYCMRRTIPFRDLHNLFFTLADARVLNNACGQSLRVSKSRCCFNVDTRAGGCLNNWQRMSCGVCMCVCTFSNCSLCWGIVRDRWLTFAAPLRWANMDWHLPIIGNILFDNLRIELFGK